MKFFAILLAVAGMAFASGTLTGSAGGTGGGFTRPGTDDILDSYAYNQAEQMGTIGASFTDYAIIDDYYGGNANMDSYTCWGVTTASVPTDLELMIVADASGVPSGAPISQDSYSVTTVNSGYTYGSYPIWIATFDFTSSPVYIDSPTWLGSHRNDGSSWYPIAGLTVTNSEGYRTLGAGWAWEPFSNSLEAGDLFKIIEGEPTSLSRDTWAGIKNMF